MTRELPGSEFVKLKKEHSVVVSASQVPPTIDELLYNVQEKDGLISLLTDPITKEVIEAGSSLKVIANYAAGYDNIDVKHATTRGIMVTNTPDVLTMATAELTWALILAVARSIPQADRYTREDKFEGWAPTLFAGAELYGSTLGIIGAGKIGTEVGIRAKGFGMYILYTDLKENATLDKIGASKVTLRELLGKADFITIHVPLTRDTYKLIGKDELALMKPTAYLINVSRGKVVDEPLLIEALINKKIAGAGFDVYEGEPKVPNKLKHLDNVVLLPHIGSATQITREQMANLAIQNLLVGLSGGIPPNLVNPEVLRNS